MNGICLGGGGGGGELTEIQSGKKQECSERKARALAHGQHSRTDRNSRWQLGNDNGEKQKQEP